MSALEVSEHIFTTEQLTSEQGADLARSNACQAWHNTCVSVLMAILRRTRRQAQLTIRSALDGACQLDIDVDGEFWSSKGRGTIRAAGSSWQRRRT